MPQVWRGAKPIRGGGYPAARVQAGTGTAHAQRRRADGGPRGGPLPPVRHRAGRLVSPRASGPLAWRQARDLDPADPRTGLLLHRPPRDRPPGREGTLGTAPGVRGECLDLRPGELRGRADPRHEAIHLTPPPGVSRLGAEPPAPASAAADPAARTPFLGAAAARLGVAAAAVC